MFETIVLGALILATFAFAERSRRQDRRQDRREFLDVMEKISGNTERIAEHTREIARLVVQNGNALARVETLTQQILTRLADDRTSH
ncbi:MAG: hypothetical protein HY268_13755 [Deltaproteobacteria bacterium]|nr:hypothetical protein [Deltaproteobacteria bacterium]